MKKIILKKKDKKAQWRGYILPLILGLIVLSLVLYFIFKEYFTEEDLNWQQCRQSVLLRGALPEADIVGMNPLKLKDEFPLKCQTNVVTIDFGGEEGDREKAEKLVADTIAQCWYMFLEAKEELFSADTTDVVTYCVPCARIHFDASVKDYYSYANNPLDIGSALDKPLQNTGVTYREYLGRGLMDVLPELTFTTKVEGKYRIQGTIFQTGPNEKSEDDIYGYYTIWSEGVGQTMLPAKLGSENGDILIFFQQLAASKGYYHSKILWFQTEQSISGQPLDPFEQLNKIHYRSGYHNIKTCDQYDGIPA